MQRILVLGDRNVKRMAEVTFDDPEEYRDSVPVDDRGRVVIGKEHAGKNVRVAVEVVDND